jgi:hypothetical protein
MSLARAYRRLAALCPTLRLTVAAPAAGPCAAPCGAADAHAPGWTDGHAPGWTDGCLLAYDDAARRAWLDAEAARVRDVYGVRAREDVVATKALHGYLWSAALLISGPWYLQRRVPYLRPRDVEVGPGGAYRVVVPGAFACLPGDPAAGSARATVRDREEDLHAELRQAVAEHVGPLLEALRPRVRRGARALWGMAGDDLVSGLWHLGRALGEEERGAELATRVLPAPLAPFPGGARFRRLPDDHPGPDRLTRTRIGCCLHYTVRGDEVCATCPRLRALAPRAAGPAAPIPAPSRPAETIRL